MALQVVIWEVLERGCCCKTTGNLRAYSANWAEQYKRNPDSIFKKWKKTDRPRILNEEHKQVILKRSDENLSVVLDDVTKRLRQVFTEKYLKAHCLVF